jgi:hypothetical protein
VQSQKSNGLGQRKLPRGKHRAGSASIELAMFMPILVIFLALFFHYGRVGGKAIQARSTVKREISADAPSQDALDLTRVAERSAFNSAEVEFRSTRTGKFPAHQGTVKYVVLSDTWDYKSVPLDEFMNPSAYRNIAKSLGPIALGHLSGFMSAVSGVNTAGLDSEMNQNAAGVDQRTQDIKRKEREVAAQKRKEIEREQVELQRKIPVTRAKKEQAEQDVDARIREIRDDGGNVSPSIEQRIDEFARTSALAPSKRTPTVKSREARLLADVAELDPELAKRVKTLGDSSRDLAGQERQDALMSEHLRRTDSQ